MNRLMVGLVVVSSVLLGVLSIEPAQAFETGQEASHIHSSQNSNRRSARAHARSSKFKNGTRKQKILVGLLLPAVQQVREAPRPSTPPPSNTGRDDCMSCD